VFFFFFLTTKDLLSSMHNCLQASKDKCEWLFMGFKIIEILKIIHLVNLTENFRLR